MIKIFTIFLIFFSKGFSEPDNNYIRSIQLNGNENVSLNEILYLVRQRPPNFFFRRPKFNPRLLKLDALTLKNFDGDEKQIKILNYENKNINFIEEEHNNFYKSIIENQKPEVSFDEGAKALEIAFLILNKIGND